MLLETSYQKIWMNELLSQPNSSRWLLGIRNQKTKDLLNFKELFVPTLNGPMISSFRFLDVSLFYLCSELWYKASIRWKQVRSPLRGFFWSMEVSVMPTVTHLSIYQSTPSASLKQFIFLVNSTLVCLWICSYAANNKGKVVRIYFQSEPL